MPWSPWGLMSAPHPQGRLSCEAPCVPLLLPVCLETLISSRVGRSALSAFPQSRAHWLRGIE